MTEDVKTLRIYLKAPHWQWLVLGGTAASAIPVLLGIWMLFGNVGPGTEGLEIFFGLTFVFGTMAAALLACLKVNKNKDRGFISAGVFMGIGVRSATFVHVCASFLVIVWAMLASGEVMGLIGLYFFSLIFHIPLWLFVTLPLSALCGWIFRLVAIEKHAR